ncbi:MAG: response regulator transcription factor [Ruminiclostridium sp.]|nr:response regulator transcription factor [Ruminiclostridium sp.]MBQ8411716.1 response regulator transcription factor [Ruminiclostridium sp.]MBQ8841569.1 response regulator transcription factor [Ruminiclostridium sp.]
MRIAVCDDELTMLKLISGLVHNEFEKNGEKAVVSAYPKASKLLSDIEEKQFDAVLLDIRMPDTDGFAAAKKIRSLSPETKIIFITTEEALVYDSFDFQPFAFIPKSPPELMRNRLAHTVENLLNALESSRRICIELPYNDKIYIKPDELIYVNSEKNNLFYHLTSGEEIITRDKIQNALEILPDKVFVRIHNRIIVNLNHIENLEYSHTSLTVTGGEELGISRTYKAEFDEAYNNWQKNHT